MIKPAVARLSAFTLLAHGDFSTSLSHVGEPLAVATLPHRKLFFLRDPELVAEATLAKPAALRDRQDVDASGNGVVAACGDAWTRRRDKLRVLLTREGLEGLAAPAAADAVAVCGCPPNALLLPPARMLPVCTRLVQHALRRVAIESAAGSEAAASSVIAVPPRPSEFAWILAAAAPLVAPLAWLISSTLRLVARISLLFEHTYAFVVPTPFFDLAEGFTNRDRALPSPLQHCPAARVAQRLVMGGSAHFLSTSRLRCAARRHWRSGRQNRAPHGQLERPAPCDPSCAAAAADGGGGRLDCGCSGDAVVGHAVARVAART
jgi:hypothetical protein